MSLLGRILSMPSRTLRPEPADTHSPVVGMPTAKVWVDEDIALTYAAVWRCVSLIASSIATLPWRLIEVDDAGNKRVLDGEPLDDMMHLQANRELGAFQFKEFLLTQALTWGNGFAEVERTNGGEAMALWPVHWSRVTVKRSEDGGRYFYMVDENGEQPITIRPENAYHLRGPTKDGFIGMSPIAHARETLSTGLSADQFAGSLYGNAAALGLVITPGKPMSKEAKSKMRAEITESYAGARNGFRAMVLDPGMTVDNGMIPPTDAQFLESRKFNVVEVCRWFGVPPHKAFDLDRATFSNIEHQGIDFVQDALNPWTKRMEQEGDRKLVRRQINRSRRTKVQTNALMRGDTKTRGEFYKVMSNVGGLSVNDILRLEDMNTIGPLGDTRLVPMNMTTLERMAAGDGGSDNGAAAATAREVCDGVYDRACRKETRAAMRAVNRCDDEEAFWRWANRFYAELHTQLQSELTPACRLVARLCGDEDPHVERIAEAAASAWVDESRRTLQADADDAARLQQIELWPDRVGLSAYALIETVAAHTAAKQQEQACSTH